jgi:diguanylate cyclase (GGDEF)-like protein/PAS domain S-box-containing protein
MILGLSAVLLVTAGRMRAADDDVGRLAAIVEASRDAIVGIGADGRVTSWNAGAVVLFGHLPDEVVGVDHSELLPSVLRPPLREHLARVRAGEPVVDWPARIVTRDGTPVDVEITISALAEEGHAFAGAAALVIRDLAERKEAEHRFAALLEAAPDGMVIVDADGDIVLVNRQMEQLFGYPREELVGQSIERLVPARLRAAHRDHRLRFGGDGHPRAMGTDLDISLVRRDGSEVPVAVSLSPLQTDAGRLVIAAVRDVSERRRSQRELAQSEERFRRSFEDSAVGMALMTADDHVGDRLLEVNDALVAITGYPADELRGHGLPVIVHPDDLPSLDRDLEDLLTGDTPVLRREVRLTGASGGLLWASLTVSLVRDAAGRPVHAVLQLQDVSERIRFEEELRHLADHDPLTGLLNRRRFEQELARELATARRYGDRGAVAVMDLDDFKLVNDSLGHAAGDELIRVVSSALAQRLRGTDVLGRMGGDEFAAVLPRVTERQALRIADVLLAAVREAAQASVVRTERRVTASIGVAVFGPGDDVTAEDVLARADIAMYDAKEDGRDRVALYDPEAPRHQGMRSRLALAERVEAALEHDRFVLHAQPIRPVDGSAERRYELLLRMVGEDGKLVGPATFLPVAEGSGLAQRIDLWVVRRALELLADPEVLGGAAAFEVNLSATTINDPTALDLIASTVSGSGIDASRLTFEITETAAIVSMRRAVVFAERMRAIGCRLALDDFGTGFASFTYLKHLAFDYVKIDGEFVEDLPSSRVNQLIVRSIVDLARGLGKKTIAEYVTDAASARLVSELGVDYVQGFHVGRPFPLPDGVAAAAGGVDAECA